MKKIISDLTEKIGEAIALAIPFGFFLSLLYIYQDLIHYIIGPLITIGLVLLGTFYSWFNGGKVAISLSVGGIITYSSSWFLIEPYGKLIATSVCGAGIVMWFIALYIAITSNKPKMAY